MFLRNRADSIQRKNPAEAGFLKLLDQAYQRLPPPPPPPPPPRGCLGLASLTLI